MKMPRDIKESLEMLLITRTGGEEARKVWRLLPTSPGWTSVVGLAGTPRAVHGAEHQFFFFFFFFFCSHPAQPSEICAIVWQRVRNIVYTAKVSSQSPAPITASRSTL